ncbi:hypothetical protein HYC85_013806 [Camellia sinensis]|uniref:Uncharacterized protein n=1 Tax=Camellia sinensis TaxID=4442 RepID=A0A7J7H4F9_CAMSI|nr:hypothetical protein HYC85_013806 [Camellia sinensis]
MYQYFDWLRIKKITKMREGNEDAQVYLREIINAITYFLLFIFPEKMGCSKWRKPLCSLKALVSYHC